MTGWKSPLASPSFILSRMTGKNSCAVALPGSYSKTVGEGGLGIGERREGVEVGKREGVRGGKTGEKTGEVRRGQRERGSDEQLVQGEEDKDCLPFSHSSFAASYSSSITHVKNCENNDSVTMETKNVCSIVSFTCETSSNGAPSPDGTESRSRSTPAA